MVYLDTGIERLADWYDAQIVFLFLAKNCTPLCVSIALMLAMYGPL